ncbi:spermidine synthase [Bermanella sp. R86510]|uniref:spermidine synthase n=1 Tax=unclassified Bermanella TaxID=2627862 RepID=UPI0037C7E3A7
MAKSIFKTYDPFGTIDVLDDANKRYLTFGNEHEQSLQIKDQPHVPQHEYSRAVMLSLLFNMPSTICVLGLGGGTQVMSLLHSLPHSHITAVELRRAVILIAKKYFQLPISSRLDLIEDDGFAYIQQSDKTFDMIIADQYLDFGIDEKMLGIPFIENCIRRLSSNGMLVLNYWQDHELDTQLVDYLHNNFASVFICNSGGGNVIVYGLMKQIEHDYMAKEHVKPLATLLGFSLNYYLKRLKQLT